MTPDPYKASAGLTDPGSWNRYAYVLGDPVNWLDPRGLLRCTSAEWMYEPGCGGPLDDSTTARSHEETGVGDARYMGGGNPSGAATAGFIQVSNPSKSGPRQARIVQVARWIQANIDDDCATWLSGVGSRIDELLGDGSDTGAFIGHGEFDNPYISAFTGNNPNQTDAPAGFAITVNDFGGFFHGSFWVRGTMYTLNSGGFAGGSSQAQVFILLHELAHSLSAERFQPDFGNEAAGRANDLLVRERCKKTLDKARRLK